MMETTDADRCMLQRCSLILTMCADGSGHLAPLHRIPTILCSNNRVACSHNRVAKNFLLLGVCNPGPHALHVRPLPHICRRSLRVSAVKRHNNRELVIQQGGSSENIPAGGMLSATFSYTRSKQRNRQA